MRLTTFTEYSLRVLVYLAAAPEGRTTIAHIAQAFGVSQHHLVKVVHFLGRHRLLANTRGRGGLRLARAPAEINVGRVVRLTEGGDMPAECFDRRRNTCVLAGGCGLRDVLAEALDNFYGTLDQYTVAELHVQPRKLRALFELRPVP